MLLHDVPYSVCVFSVMFLLYVYNRTLFHVKVSHEIKYSLYHITYQTHVCTTSILCMMYRIAFFVVFARPIFCGITISCIAENFHGLNIHGKQVVQSGYTCWQHGQQLAGQRKRVGPPDLDSCPRGIA